MFRPYLYRVVPLFLALVTTAILSQTIGNSDRIQLKLNSDELKALSACYKPHPVRGHN